MKNKAQSLGQTSQNSSQQKAKDSANTNPKAKIPAWQSLSKLILAVVLTLVTVGGILFGIGWFSSPNFRNFVQNGALTKAITGQNNNNSEELAKLREKLEALNNQDIFYQNVKLTDLPIYPSSWVERNFNETERKNALISGESADSDGDGLSNKEEYFYGSNPKNADSLCSGQKNATLPGTNISCSGRSDKQNVDNNISPLTGLELDTPEQFRILQQDFLVIQGLKDSFETASREGVEFPVLYQLSKKIDLASDYNEIKVTELADNTESFLEYRQLRLDVLKDFVSDDELSSLSQIYQVTRPEQFETIKKQYQTQLDKLTSSGIPKKYVPSHKAYILTFKKLIALVEHRQTGLKDNKLEEETFRQTSQQKAVEVVWGYRRLSEELAKIEE